MTHNGDCSTIDRLQYDSEHGDGMKIVSATWQHRAAAFIKEDLPYRADDHGRGKPKCH